MAPRIGYLLPTREQIMEGQPEAAPLLKLAERAAGARLRLRSGSATRCWRVRGMIR